MSCGKSTSISFIPKVSSKLFQNGSRVTSFLFYQHIRKFKLATFLTTACLPTGSELSRCYLLIENLAKFCQHGRQAEVSRVVKDGE